MILEGAMIVIAILSLTALHPGVCFDGLWDQTKWKFRGDNNEMGILYGNQGGKAHRAESPMS